MAQLGFVIDQSRCIGCHACTVACKAENDVPLDHFRTWVKYTEEGAWPAVKRSFTVLRCNQCTDAPCVTICPVSALEKRKSDGIVDVDPDVCIGCKACLQGCPYDALYIHPDRGTAQKCHFCAHRTERGLAPACVVVCPTEALIPGDFHDPQSRVSRLRAEHDLTRRKVEAGTGPNVWYRSAADAGLDPGLTNGIGGSIWADRREGFQSEVDLFAALAFEPKARTVYDVEHPPHWGGKITGYLVTKALAAGAFLAGLFVMPPFAADLSAHGAWAIPALGLILLTVTSLLLVLDLKRPERFWTILTRPNWDSWLARGTYFLVGYGALLTAWLGIGIARPSLPTFVSHALAGLTAILAALSACYTAWLFAQAKGRVLWMQKGLAWHLIVKALLGGAGLLLIVAPVLDVADLFVGRISLLALVVTVIHAAFSFGAGTRAPAGREAEYARVWALVTRGPFARAHHISIICIALGAIATTFGPWAAFAGGIAIVFGLVLEEDVLVHAGQALRIS